MASYQPYWATRGHLAAKAGRIEEAHDAFTLAIGLATDSAVRRHLQNRRDALRNG
jgi:RNA polymerase sigma-70 factor (ECF subfamily)